MVEKREKRGPVIHNVFPVSRNAALKAAQRITSVGRANDVPNRILHFVKSMASENPEITGLFSMQLSLGRSLLGFDPAQEADVWLGAIYAYEALRAEAQRRDGRLPTISHDEIGTYISDHTNIGEIPLSRQIQYHSIEAVGREIDRYLHGKTESLSAKEPCFVEGFQSLVRTWRVDAISESVASGGAYQMYAVFKTHSEIHQIRQIAKRS